jgi:hypothetical protein
MSLDSDEVKARVHQMWVHGTTVRPEWVHDNLQQVRGGTWDSAGQARDVPWSDVNGLPLGWGTAFRGRRAFTGGIGGSTTGPFDPVDPFHYSQKGYWFHFAIPTPVMVYNGFSRLLRVFVLWEASSDVEPWAVHVWDGPTLVHAFSVTNPPGLNPTGTRGLADLVDGVSRFELPAPHTMLFSVGISIAVAFINDGNITFFSAGADFDLRGERP